jgi:hypothetical protein
MWNWFWHDDAADADCAMLQPQPNRRSHQLDYDSDTRVPFEQPLTKPERPKGLAWKIKYASRYIFSLMLLLFCEGLSKTPVKVRWGSVSTS